LYYFENCIVRFSLAIYSRKAYKLLSLIVSCMRNGVYSIGYQGKTIGSFMNELAESNISLLVDVRRNAFSFKKGFSKNQLRDYLKKAKIGYLHLPEFGIEAGKRKDLHTAQDYKILFADYRKNLRLENDRLEYLKALGRKQRIALMCFEADKNFCHRGVLSDFLNCGVVHI